MKLDPVELRGVGIQITKLEGETGKSNEREAGQGMLSFGKKRGDDANPRSESVKPIAPSEAVKEVEEEVEVRPASRSRSGTRTRTASPDRQDKANREKSSLATVAVAEINAPAAVDAARRVVVAGPSRLAAAASSDGIDPDFLAALPDELRQEVKRDHAMTRARARAGSEMSNSDKTAGETTARERSTTVSPAKAKGRHAAAHITKQLRPGVKTQLKAAAISDLPLYGAWNKAKLATDEIVDLSAEADVADSEKVGNYFVKDLRELGIDPLFLKDLPEEMQKEVVDQELAVSNRRNMLHRPADTSRVRAKAKERGRASVSPTRSSRAGSVPVLPRIIGPTVTRPAKPKLFNATTLPEVSEIITKWIDSRRGSGPAVKDAGKVKAYLVKCMTPEYGLGGLEMAVDVLKFMRVEIDERWEEEGCEDDLVGREWWDTWRGFKEAVDQLSRATFGTGLRL
jgi:DNA repair protein REV1